MQMWGTGLRHYIWVIRHWLWLILLGMFITTGITYFVNKHITPVYQANALIQVNGTGNPNSDDVFSRQAVALTYSLLVTDTDVLQAATQKVPGVSVSQLKKTVSDSPLDNSQIIEIRSQSDNPQKAADIANAVATTFIQIESTQTHTRLKNTESQLAKSLATTKQTINADEALLASLQQAHTSQDQITHQQDVLATDQANYNSLLTSYNTVQQEDIQSAGILGIAQTATAPETPTSPQTVLNTVIAALMSLLLMLVLVLLLDWLDATIQTPEDVAHLAMLEALGTVPFSAHPQLLDGSTQQGVVRDSAVEETFTILGTSFDTLSKGQHAVMVTGVRPGAGTSTIAANLALSLAWAGKRVLLIDANLRRPTLHTMFHQSNTKGLTTSLGDVNRFRKDVVLPWLNQWSTTTPNLWLLPAGPITNDPTMVMRSPELQRLVGWVLRKNQSYIDNDTSGVVDFIIFDAPTLKESADAVALSNVTNGTVLVVEAGKERKETLDNAVAVLQRLSSPLLGVIVNRQKAKHRSYFYVNRRRQDVVATENPLVVAEFPSSAKPTSLLDMPSVPTTPPLDMSQQNGGSYVPITPFIGIDQQNTATVRIGPLKNYARPGSNGQVGEQTSDSI